MASFHPNAHLTSLEARLNAQASNALIRLLSREMQTSFFLQLIRNQVLGLRFEMSWRDPQLV